MKVICKRVILDYVLYYLLFQIYQGENVYQAKCVYSRLVLDANVHAERSAPKSETAADVTN